MFRPQIDISIVVTSRSYNVKRNKIVSYCQIYVILPYHFLLQKATIKFHILKGATKRGIISRWNYEINHVHKIWNTPLP